MWPKGHQCRVLIVALENQLWRGIMMCLCDGSEFSIVILIDTWLSTKLPLHEVLSSNMPSQLCLTSMKAPRFYHVSTDFTLPNFEGQTDQTCFRWIGGPTHEAVHTWFGGPNLQLLWLFWGRPSNHPSLDLRIKLANPHACLTHAWLTNVNGRLIFAKLDAFVFLINLITNIFITHVDVYPVFAKCHNCHRLSVVDLGWLCLFITYVFLLFMCPIWDTHCIL